MTYVNSFEHLKYKMYEQAGTFKMVAMGSSLAIVASDNSCPV